MFGRRASNNNSAENSAAYGNSPQPMATATTPGGGSFRSTTPSSASALYRRDLTTRGSGGRPFPNSSGSSSGSGNGGGVPGASFLFPPVASVPSSAFSPSSAFHGCHPPVDKSGIFLSLFYHPIYSQILSDLSFSGINFTNMEQSD